MVPSEVFMVSPSAICRLLLLAMVFILPFRSLIAQEVRIEKNIDYLGGDRAERGDLYRPPETPNAARHPGIVIIHGGGWTGGDKGAAREINIGTTLAANGYVCLSINYALAAPGTPTFPQNIHDCKRAVRWLRKNAERLNIDAQHIGAIGGSAGGHLTALLAVAGPDAGLDPAEDSDISCRIQAAVPMYPHCAAAWEGGTPLKTYDSLPMFAQTKATSPALWDSALPVKQLSKDDPPLLILHGTADTTTPLNQSTRLHEAALAAGISSQLIVIEGAPHSFHLQPAQRDLRPDVLAFFNQHLRPAAAAAKETPRKTASGNLFQLTARASEIDPRAQQHPAIGFVFSDEKGRPQDLQHARVDTRVTQRGQLVIWLMDHNPGLFERLSSYGLHAISVHYARGWFGKIDAARRDDGKTLGDIRLEAATGQNHSPLVDIPLADSLEERALQFVKWLAEKNPDGGWTQFLTPSADSLQWDHVILAGISHGSTTAARLAKHRRVARVVMFSGPRDQYESWQGLESATPANRYFGFTHVLDTGWTGDHYCRSWILLGLHQFGPLVDVDAPLPPGGKAFGHSRRLITQANVNNSPDRAHTMVVPGGTAVKDPEGRFLHEAVWKYVFTHPVENTGSPVPAEADCRMK
ncbi:MAG: hypothetical protein RL215_3357 [Planctomycetota bacterium]|jgi:acetyl esterase/lipase